MLDNLFSAIGGDVVKDLTQKAGISTDQAQQVLPIAKDTLTKGLMDQVTGGNIGAVTGLFKAAGNSGLAGNPLFSGIKQQFMKNMMTKMGLPESVAGIVAGLGLENIIGKIAGKLKNDKGEVEESNLLGQLGLGGGIGDMAKGMLGNKLKDIGGGLFGK